MEAAAQRHLCRLLGLRGPPGLFFLAPSPTAITGFCGAGGLLLLFGAPTRREGAETTTAASGTKPPPRLCSLLAGIPASHDLLGFLQGCEAPPQLGHVLPHGIFNDPLFFNPQNHLLGR